MRAITMSDSLTGKPHIDLIALGLAWILAAINWNFLVGLFSIMASVFVVVSKGLEIYDRWASKRKRRK
jgi:hypothetical protein